MGCSLDSVSVSDSEGSVAGKVEVLQLVETLQLGTRGECVCVLGWGGE